MSADGGRRRTATAQQTYTVDLHLTKHEFEAILEALRQRINGILEPLNGEQHRTMGDLFHEWREVAREYRPTEIARDGS